MNKEFIHLHVHNIYSVLDGLASEKELVAEAVKQGMSAVALTNHGAMFGMIPFYKECVENGIKPIIGSEMYLADDHKVQTAQKFNKHITLLAKDNNGYKNLMKLQSLAYKDGYYYKPRVDFGLLREHADGIICLSGCLKGPINVKLAAGLYEEAADVARTLKDIFGADFYIELMNHGIKEEMDIIGSLIEIARTENIPIVATNDVHYMERDDSKTQEILMCIQMKKTLKSEHLKLTTPEFYFKSADEMVALFINYPDAIENTVKIANKCNVNITFGELHLPKFCSDDVDENQYLKDLCYKGLVKRFSEGELDVANKRLHYELGIVKDANMSGYFLIVWDFIREAVSKGIRIGFGRGSGAGSIIAYCLGITAIDPIKYGLIFERFLNPGSKKMPDLDIDIESTRRAEIIDYLLNKYPHSAQVVTYGQMKIKNSIRDVARVLGYHLDKVNKICAKIPATAETMEDVAALPDIQPFLQDPVCQEIFKHVTKLQGVKRYIGIHAAAMVISEIDLNEYIPLAYAPSQKTIITQYNGEEVLELGLLKVDLLGLKTLSILDMAFKAIKKSTGQEIDIHNIPLDDKKTYALLKKGYTEGVFQLGSSGMKDLLVRMSPSKISDIIATEALYRPGPLSSGLTDQYIDSKRGNIVVEYPHPSLMDILKDTYGVMLYQEQIIQVAVSIANFSITEGDVLRTALSKKKQVLIDQLSVKFSDGAAKNNIDPITIRKVWSIIEQAAKYSFNLSHSTAYGLLSYYTAYLKANFPTEYMMSILNNDFKNEDKVISHIKECRKMGIRIEAPNVNESFEKFTVKTPKVIRYGLCAIKNVGIGDCNAIEKARTENLFQTFDEFMKRMRSSKQKLVNKRALEALIYSGAFDCMGDRSEIIKQLEQKKEKSKQSDLFNVDVGVNEPKEKGLSNLDILYKEKEVLGWFASKHPVEYAQGIETYCSHTISELFKLKGRYTVKIGGIILNPKKLISAKKSAYVKFVLEDLKNSVDCVIFSSVLDTIDFSYTTKLPVIVVGNYDSSRGKSVIVSRIDVFSGVKAQLRKIKITVKSEQSDNFSKKMLELIKLYPGNDVIQLHMKVNELNFVLQCTKYRIGLTPECYSKLKQLVGNQNVEIL